MRGGMAVKMNRGMCLNLKFKLARHMNRVGVEC